MTYYLDCLEGEYWWGGAVAHGTDMPFSAEKDYELNGTINRTNNQYNALFVSSRGRYIYAENGCILRAEGGQITLSETKGEVDIAEGFGTLKNAYRAAAKKHFYGGKTVPEDMVLSPQYSTWVEMLRCIDQRRVEEYAEGIINSGMPAGVLILDDGWMRGYGDWRFDEKKFPDPRGMIEKLHALGFKTVLWVCPFADTTVEGFSRLEEKGAFVRDHQGKIALRRWWNGTSAVFDMSAPAAGEYLSGQLKELTVLGADGFKFDAGDPCYYDSDDLTCARTSPNGQSKLWAQFAARYSYSELRACVGMGGYPIVQRLADKDSSWKEKGILSLIPNMLQAGVSGYAYCCPDMVGGGQEADFGCGKSHDDELMVRSCQCSALMPMMQFSYAIWNRSSPFVRTVVDKCVGLRKSRAEYFRSLLEENRETRDPLMRHMEYEFPGQGMERVNDQFMLGAHLLVAPVLYKGMTAREVILPAGCKWKYLPTGKVYEGGRTVNVEAPVDVLPYFERA